MFELCWTIECVVQHTVTVVTWLAPKRNFSNTLFLTFRSTLRERPSIHDGRREPHVCLPHQARQPDHGRTDMKANTSPSPFESSMHAAVSTTRLRWVLSKRYATRVLFKHAYVY